MSDESATSQSRHVLVVNSQQRQIVILEADAYRIGRSNNNDIVLPYNTISRHHASLFRVFDEDANPVRYKLTDGSGSGKQSINGLFINGKRTCQHELTHKDLISFGQIVEALYINLNVCDAQLSSFLESTDIDLQLTSNNFTLKPLSPIEATSIMLGGPAQYNSNEGGESHGAHLDPHATVMDAVLQA